MQPKGIRKKIFVKQAVMVYNVNVIDKYAKLEEMI